MTVNISIIAHSLEGVRVRRKSLMINPYTGCFEHYAGFVISASDNKPYTYETEYGINRAVCLRIQFDLWMDMGRPDGEGDRILSDPWYEYKFLLDGYWLGHDDLWGGDQ